MHDDTRTGHRIAIQRRSAPADRSDPIRLPAVIRPAPLHLHEVERRANRDPEFARALAARPELCATLARALLARDPDARGRFADHAALAAHLRGLRAG